MAHIETRQIQVEMHPAHAVPASISVVAFGISLSAFLAISLCILFYVLFPGSAEQHVVLSLFLPWLKLLTWPGFLLGLAASIVCGWYITLIFCPLYNYFTTCGLCRVLDFGHFAAALRAAAAKFGATSHFLAANALAGYSAGFAYICASGAFRSVEMRVANHEVSCGLAGLDTIDHQLHMCLFDMIAAHFQAVVEKRLLAFVTAFPAKLNTFVH